MLAYESFHKLLQRLKRAKVEMISKINNFKTHVPVPASQRPPDNLRRRDLILFTCVNQLQQLLLNPHFQMGEYSYSRAR